jgi:CheY-like chemotaxis protein
MRILIVEDDAPLARSIATLLRGAGHAVDHVAMRSSSSTSACPTSTASPCSTGCAGAARRCRC